MRGELGFLGVGVFRGVERGVLCGEVWLIGRGLLELEGFKSGGGLGLFWERCVGFVRKWLNVGIFLVVWKILRN